MRGSRQTLSKLFCQRGGDQHTHAGDQAVNSIITTTTNLLLCKELRNSLGGWLATLDFVTGFVVWRGSVTVFLILLARRVRTRTARIRPWPGIWIWAWTRPAKRKKKNNLLKWKSLHAATTVSCLSELNWWPDHLVASVSPALSLSSEGKTKRWHNEMKIQSFFLCNDPFSWMFFFFLFHTDRKWVLNDSRLDSGDFYCILGAANSPFALSSRRIIVRVITAWRVLKEQKPFLTYWKMLVSSWPVWDPERALAP